MIFRVGIENNNDDRSIAWALEHPGCFAYGPDATSAQASFPAAGHDYAAWVSQHGGTWLSTETIIEATAEETFDVTFVDHEFEPASRGHGSMVESFFRYDWKPLTADEIGRALKILEWSRKDLLAVVRPLQPEQLSRKQPGERWDINGILKHVAGAEWWYQERLGFPFPQNEEDLPAAPLESLAMVREHFAQLLPSLEGMNRVIGLEGELWSPRKVLRRAAWHERDHTQHILKLL